MKNDRFPQGPKSIWRKHAIDICDGKAVIPAEEVPELLAWLKDYNWPGAHEIAGYLIANRSLVRSHVERILASSSDASWKYTLIVSLILQWPRDDVATLASSLLSLARGDDREEVHLVALEALIRNRLIDPASAQLLLENKYDQFPELAADLDELTRVIGGRPRL